MLQYTLVFTLLLGGIVMPSPALANTESLIQNNVSVSASGRDSSASVRTTINGEVIEDTTVTSDDGAPIRYESTVTSDNSDVVVTTSTTFAPSSTAADQSDLTALLETLRALVARYVTLLSL